MSWLHVHHRLGLLESGPGVSACSSSIRNLLRSCWRPTGTWLSREAWGASCYFLTNCQVFTGPVTFTNGGLGGRMPSPGGTRPDRLLTVYSQTLLRRAHSSPTDQSLHKGAPRSQPDSPRSPSRIHQWDSICPVHGSSSGQLSLSLTFWVTVVDSVGSPPFCCRTEC